MSRERVKGLQQAYSLFDRLPVEARHELQDLLGRVSRDVEAGQKNVVAKKSGALRAGITSQVDAEALTARTGLLGVARGRSKLFYGRPVERGRIAQTVVVTRRLKRKIKGNGRNGTKRRMIYAAPSDKVRPRSSPNAGTRVGSPYKLRVKSMAARPFIAPPGVRKAADQKVADYWAKTFSRLKIES